MSEPGAKLSKRGIERWQILLVMLVVWLWHPSGLGILGVAESIAPLRLAFSTRMFNAINENDARAAIRTWALTLVQEQGIPVDPDTKLLAGTNAILTALCNEQVDGIALTTVEYWALRQTVSLGTFIIGLKAGQITEEYVLVARADSGWQQLGDLRGRRLCIFDQARACLAPVWLETLLLQNGCGRTEQFYSRVTCYDKLTKVVLPVFFGQADVCLVTRDGFQTMSELNPQIGQQLKILAVSPPLVPSFFCFRANYNAPYRERLLAAISQMHKNPPGR